MMFTDNSIPQKVSFVKTVFPQSPLSGNILALTIKICFTVSSKLSFCLISSFIIDFLKCL